MPVQASFFEQKVAEGKDEGLNNPKCASCGAKMKKNGSTPAGTQRRRCKSCGASSVRRIDNSAKALEAFLAWLLSKDSIADLKTSRATFWRKYGSALKAGEPTSQP